MVNYRLNVFHQKVDHYYLKYLSCNSITLIVPTVSTIKNTKPDGDLTPPNGAVCKDHTVDDNGQINSSEAKLKGMMMEMNQTLNKLTGSVTAPDSDTSQVVLMLNL